MPHYADGTEAKLNDLVYGKTHAGTDPIAGYVVEIQPSASACNVQLATIRPFNGGGYYGALLNLGTSNPDTDRRNFAPKVELANCIDLSLLHRPSDPENQ